MIHDILRSLIDAPKSNGEQVDLKRMLDHGEEILWTGCPAFVSLVIPLLPLIAFAALWGLFDISFFLSMGFVAGFMSIFTIPFFIFHMFPVWMAIYSVVTLRSKYANTMYALTNKRLLYSGGAWSVYHSSIEYDTITSISVSIDQIEKHIGVGTLSIITNGHESHTFQGISESYDVAKQLNTIMSDMKMDLHYPNALRMHADK